MSLNLPEQLLLEDLAVARHGEVAEVGAHAHLNLVGRSSFVNHAPPRSERMPSQMLPLTHLERAVVELASCRLAGWCT